MEYFIIFIKKVPKHDLLIIPKCITTFTSFTDVIKCTCTIMILKRKLKSETESCFYPKLYECSQNIHTKIQQNVQK